MAELEKEARQTLKDGAAALESELASTDGHKEKWASKDNTNYQQFLSDLERFFQRPQEVRCQWSSQGRSPNDQDGIDLLRSQCRHILRIYTLEYNKVGGVHTYKAPVIPYKLGGDVSASLETTSTLLQTTDFTINNQL